jgi:hypothetical protein
LDLSATRKTNEDIATKYEADLPHCVRNVKKKNVLLFKFRCNIFIGVRIVKEMTGSVASGTPCIIITEHEINNFPIMCNARAICTVNMDDGQIANRK